MPQEILRFPAVEQITGLSRTTIWRMERAGSFPSRRMLSPNCIGWVRSEVERWVQTRKPAEGKR